MPLVFVPLSHCRDNARQHRRHYDADAVEQTAESILRGGLDSPPKARLANAAGIGLGLNVNTQVFYDPAPGRDELTDLGQSEDVAMRLAEHGWSIELAFGHRRLRAMVRAWEIAAGTTHGEAVGADLVGADGFPGLRGVPAGTMPVWLEPMTDEQMARKALVENVQREDPSEVELAYGMQTMAVEFGYSHERLAELMGYGDRTQVTHRLGLLRLPESAQEMNRDGRLSYSKARALVPLFSLDGERERVAALEIVRGQKVGITRAELVQVAAVASSAADVTASVTRFLEDVDGRLRLEREEREPSMFAGDVTQSDTALAVTEPPVLLDVSAEVGRIHQALDTHATHVENIAHRSITEEVRGAVQRLIRTDIAEVSQAALRLGDALLSADVAALRDRAFAEVERYRDALAEPRAAPEGPEPDDLPASITQSEAEAELERLEGIARTADAWCTEASIVRTVARDVVQDTVDLLESLESELSELLGRDAFSNTLLDDVRVERLGRSIDDDLVRYSGELARRDREAVQNQVETVADPVPPVTLTPATAPAAAPSVPKPAKIDPAPAWPVPVLDNVHGGLGKMTKAQLVEVDKKHDVKITTPEMGWNGRLSVYDKKADILAWVVQRLTYSANLACAVRLTDDQVDAVDAMLDELWSKKGTRAADSFPKAFRGRIAGSYAEMIRTIARVPMGEGEKAFRRATVRRLLVTCYKEVREVMLQREQKQASAKRVPSKDGPWVHAAKVALDRGMDMVDAMDDFDDGYREVYERLEELREQDRPDEFAAAQAELADVGRARALLGATTPPAPQSVVLDAAADVPADTPAPDDYDETIAASIEAHLATARERHAVSGGQKGKKRLAILAEANAAEDAAQKDLYRYADASTPEQVEAMCARLGIDPPSPDVGTAAETEPLTIGGSPLVDAATGERITHHGQMQVGHSYVPEPQPLTPEERLEAIFAGDVSHLATMPDVELKRARDRAFLSGVSAETREAIRTESERRNAEFDAPANAGDGAATPEPAAPTAGRVPPETLDVVQAPETASAMIVSFPTEGRTFAQAGQEWVVVVSNRDTGRYNVAHVSSGAIVIVRAQTPAGARAGAVRLLNQKTDEEVARQCALVACIKARLVEEAETAAVEVEA